MPAGNRERVLRAATDSFLARGYASSVDEIARRAGVAKQTVYHHFASKDRLFQEVAQALTKAVLVELGAEPRDLRAGLLRFALAYRARVLGAQGIASFRTVLPEIVRFRGLAKRMYTASAGEMVRQLAAYLERGMASGELRKDDPEFAAEVLLGMLVGQDRLKRLFGVHAANGSDAARSAQIIDCFLRAYKP